MNSEYWQERTELLIGKDSIAKLQKAHVLVVGLGGVGAYAAENICRAGVGEMTIVDGDFFHPSNKNRQLSAMESTIGQPKAEVLGKRLIDINPELKLNVIQEYIKEDKNKKSTVGTISYMPAVFGCFCASVVIRDLIENKNELFQK